MEPRRFFGGAIAPVLVATTAASAGPGDPWADRVVEYTPGSNAVSGFTNDQTALGSPERLTGELAGFPGAISPFNPAFGTDEIVSVGSGGSLTLAFDEPIRNDAANPFGIDFLVFGNAGFIANGFPDATTGPAPALFGVGGVATVQVSADGMAWTTLATTTLDLFPTLGYANIGPFDSSPGSVPTDFTRPVDPSLGLSDLAGLDTAGLAEIYAGSGGGVGFDLAGSGLGEISFVRFLNLSDAAFEIDAVSDVAVPAPSGAGLILCSLAIAARRRR